MFHFVCGKNGELVVYPDNLSMQKVVTENIQLKDKIVCENSQMILNKWRDIQFNIYRDEALATTT